MSYTFTNTDVDNSTEAGTVAALVSEGAAPEPINMEAPVYYNPASKEFTDLEAYRAKPARNKSQYHPSTVPSFLSLVDYFNKQERVVVFCYGARTIECVLNHSTAEAPGFEDCGIKLTMDFDERFAKWKGVMDQALSQKTFMEFLEDRIGDVVQDEKGGGASQAALVAFVSDLKLTTDARFSSAKNLTNGNFRLECSEVTTTNVEVPARFYLGLPVFEGEPTSYLIPVRLRYRLSEGKVIFTILLDNFDAILKKAWGTVRDSVIAGLPAPTDAQDSNARVPFYDAESCVL